MERPDKTKWDESVGEEHQRMQDNGVFEAIPIAQVPIDADVIDSTWAMKKKANGVYHARLAARGFKQRAGVSYDPRDIMSPVVHEINRSLLSSGGLMADVPCLDHSLDSCKGRPDDVQTTKHARRTHAWSRCARTSLGAHASLFGASGARFWIVTRATSARIEEPSMVSILYIKSSIPDTYK